MTVRATCVPADRLTALALAAHAPENEHDQPLLAHVAGCEACTARLAAITADMDALREAACHEVDAIFDEAALDTQRTKILDRLTHLGQAARVLRFPGRTREAAMPVSPISRRWVSVAAAAGLLIGLLAGQLIHFVPWDTHRSSTSVAQKPDARPARGVSGGAVIVQAASSVTTISEEELLGEIDEAMQLRRAQSLRALDAYTPRVGELVEIR